MTLDGAHRIVAPMVDAESRTRVTAEVRGRLLASLAGLVALTLALASFVRLPGRTLVISVLGSDVSYEFSGAAQYTLLLALLVCTGLTAIHRVGRTAPATRLSGLSLFWGLPLLIALGALLLIDTLSWWGYQIIGAVAVGLMLAVVIALQLRSSDEGQSASRLVLNGITFAVALSIFMSLFGARLRSVISSTAIVGAAALLSTELFRDSHASARDVWAWSLMVGLVMGELTWAMNYTRLSTRPGGVLLLVCFYTVSGLAQQHLWGRLSRQAVTEFLVVLLGGIAVVVALS